MTNRKAIVIRILLLIARIVNDDDTLAAELKTIETHINVHGGKS
jgi:hypothetical protein